MCQTELTGKALYYTIILRRLSCNHRYRGKEINITYSECVSVSLFIKHAVRMCPIILSSVP